MEMLRCILTKLCWKESYKIGQGSLQELELELKGKEEGQTHGSQAVCGSLSIAPSSCNPPCVAELEVSRLPLQNLCLRGCLLDPTQEGCSHVIGRGSHVEGSAGGGLGGGKWGLWQPWDFFSKASVLEAAASDSFRETPLPPVFLKAKYTPVLNPFLLEYLELFYIFDHHDAMRTQSTVHVITLWKREHTLRKCGRTITFYKPAPPLHVEPISKAGLASQVSAYIHLLSPVTITPGWPSLHHALQWAGSSQSPTSSSRPKFSVTSYTALILKVFHGYFLPPQSWSCLVVQSLQSLATPTSSPPLPESSYSSQSGSHSIVNTPCTLTPVPPFTLAPPQNALATSFRDRSGLSSPMKPSPTTHYFINALLPCTEILKHSGDCLSSPAQVADPQTSELHTGLLF